MPTTATIDESLHQGLTSVAGHGFPVMVSPALEQKSAAVAKRVGRAHRFLADVLGYDAPFAMLLLSPEDWEGRSAHPLYGMPNYKSGNLILAGEVNPFWRGFVDMIAGESQELSARLATVYGSADEDIDLSPFFDLLAVHELVHIFQEDVGLTFPRLWMMEFACNLGLHGYVANVEPQTLPVLETFPAAFIAIDPSRFAVRDLQGFEDAYAHGMDGANYGWFQCHFHAAAGRVYNAYGIEGFTRLWKAFAAAGEPAKVSDTELLAVLERDVGSEVARIAREWPER